MKIINGAKFFYHPHLQPLNYCKLDTQTNNLFVFWKKKKNFEMEAPSVIIIIMFE